MTMLKNSDVNSDEEIMFNDLQRALNSDFLIQMLKRNWKEVHSISLLGNLIGEVYNHLIINKDGYGFEMYMSRMEKLYVQLGKNEITQEQFDLKKAEIISYVIASRLWIDTSREFSDVETNKIKNYFLNEYVVNGYVSHSFPDVYKESIMNKGLVPSVSGRGESNFAFQEIQEIFMKKGIAAPLGGYPYYGGSGIYYEHDFTKVFQHAINSPEWFNWFTSSNHLKGFQSIECSPYILRDEQACRRNIIDLCINAQLSEDESKKVMMFYLENYKKFASSTLNVGLIPKRVVGKNDISKSVKPNLGLYETIISVMNDSENQYKEHVGNVCNDVILPQNIKLSHIPDASKFISVSGYVRESKDNLTNPYENLNILLRARDNSSKMNDRMYEMVEKTCEFLESRIKVLEFQNMVNVNAKVKSLKKTIDNSGYANIINLSLVLVFSFATAFIIVVLLLK